MEAASRIFINEGATRFVANIIGTDPANEKESCQTATLLIVNACIMHKRLEETGSLTVKPIGEINIVENPISALETEWQSILDKDYKPIFKDAATLLQTIPHTEAYKEAISILIQCAIENATTLNELGFDHAGPLFHKVISSFESDGAFYTRNISAYLLAGLGFNDSFMDWSNLAEVEKLRVIDPACGTGTLLMAALNAIKQQAQKHHDLDDIALNELHRKLVENSIYGLDINKLGIQLAACNLTIGAPNTDYRKINLATSPYGPQGEEGMQYVRQGSIELLVDDSWQKSFFEPTEFKGETVMEGELTTIPETFNAVIFNPPFTDTSKQGKKFDESIIKQMRERLKEIKNHPKAVDSGAESSISKNSIQPFFTVLANKLIEGKSGHLFKVMPATVATSNNAQQQRRYLASNFHIEIIITSHDPKNINFSESTSIHECLLIGRRYPQNKPEANSKETRFIQLTKFPQDIDEAQKLIESINSNTQKGYKEILWPAEKIQKGDWSPVQWLNSNLAKTIDIIDSYSRLVPIEDILQINSTFIPFMQYFHYEDKSMDDSKEVKAFCTINEQKMQTIQSAPTHFAVPKVGSESKANNLLARTSYLHLVSRFATTSSRLTAFYSEACYMGSAYYTLEFKQFQNCQDSAKILALFFNSSFGIIQMLNRRTKKLTYPTFEKGHLATLKILDPATIDPTPLLETFEQVKNTPLQRLSQAHVDETRQTIDHAIADAIDFPRETTDQWRLWLSQEPTITNKPYQQAF